MQWIEQIVQSGKCNLQCAELLGAGGLDRELNHSWEQISAKMHTTCKSSNHSSEQTTGPNYSAPKWTLSCKMHRACRMQTLTGGSMMEDNWHKLYTLCTNRVHSVHNSLCKNANYVPKCRQSTKYKKHFATCKWSGGVGDWAMVQNRQLLWAQVVHRVHTELSHRSTLYCNYCTDIHKLCFAGTRAHSCWAKTNAHNIHIWPWKLSPPAQMEHKCKCGQLSEITPLEA